MTLIIIICGAALFGLYLMGKMTRQGQLHTLMNTPIVDERVIPEWAKVLMLIVIVCAVIIWIAG
jgi:hypothetical protein